MAGGVSVVSFMDLTPAERCIVRLVLRETSISYPHLREAVATMPADQQMDQAKLTTTLNHLLRTRWLLCESVESQLIYRVNALQRSGASWDDLEAEPRSAKRGVPTHIWDCLTDPEPEPPAPKRRTGLFDKLISDDGASKEA